MSVRVLLHVQHLKGTGHQHRSAAIARALAGRGAVVTYATGGPPVAEAGLDGVRLERLPSVRADGPGYAALVDASGAPIDDAWRARRRDAALAVLARVEPHVLVLETFPFGRRKLRFEMLALIDAARRLPRPAAVVTSVRDVPEPRVKASERRQMVELAERHIDAVLVHGDPAVATLEDTFPEARRLAQRVVHTGYVVDDRSGPLETADGQGEVVVSAGGGAAGERLLVTGIEAAALDRFRGRRWRVLVGRDASPGLLRAAREPGDAGLVVEPNRADFPGLLHACAASVSQAGYNTVLDIVRARVPAVVVPHEEGGEREQSIRAALFADRGLLEVLPAAELTPRTLAGIVDRAARGPRPTGPGVDLGGAARAADVILELAARA